jgi:hypothetical protein
MSLPLTPLFSTKEINFDKNIVRLIRPSHYDVGIPLSNQYALTLYPRKKINKEHIYFFNSTRDLSRKDFLPKTLTYCNLSTR